MILHVSADFIPLNEITNLAQLFCSRVRRTPNQVAYHYYDPAAKDWRDWTWSDMADHVARWQAALKAENLGPGERVALMVNNCPQWVMYEQAAIGLGLVVVPLYTNDRPENISYIVNDAQIRVLLLETAEQWSALKQHCRQLPSLQRIVCMEPLPDNETEEPRLAQLNAWLPDPIQRYAMHELKVHKSTLATIVYTSGTTGKPKGVMLSHENIFWNANAPRLNVPVYPNDVFLSFLPLSHMYERTVGYYLPMICGCKVIYARSIEKLSEDLVLKKPTILITVPRIFERVYNKINTQLAEKSSFAQFLFKSAVAVGWQRFRHLQGKQAWHPKLLLWPLLFLLVGRKIMKKLGGHLRVAVSGGAPLAAEIARTFIGLGLTISQGYGMTEASPVISTNKLDDNEPDSVGQPLPDVEVRLGEDDELLVRSPGVMLGYWNQDDATQLAIDRDGWLHTGDKARIEHGHIYITGRLKDILVLSNGEKLPPADLEMAITDDPLFEQVIVIGEQKPYLTAILVLNPEEWPNLAAKLKLTPSAEHLNHPLVHEQIISRLQPLMTGFPGYAKIYRVHTTLEPWTVENGLLTPTLKLKRQPILSKFSQQIAEMYKGH